MMSDPDQNTPWKIDVTSIRSPKLNRKKLISDPDCDEMKINYLECKTEQVFKLSPRKSKHRSSKSCVRFDGAKEPDTSKIILGEKRTVFCDDIPKKKVRFEVNPYEEGDTAITIDDNSELVPHDKTLKRQRFVAFDFPKTEPDCAKKKKADASVKEEIVNDIFNLKSLCLQFEHANINQ